MIRSLRATTLLATSASHLIPTRTLIRANLLENTYKYVWEERYEFLPSHQPWRKYKDPFIPTPLDTDETYTDVVESAEDYKFVQFYLPRDTIPPLPARALTHYPTPSGFIPPLPNPPPLPYYVRRSVYHNLPVYSFMVAPGNRGFTRIRHVEGDIWALENDLVKFLRPRVEEGLVATKVDEVQRQVLVKGDRLDLVKEFLLEKGF